MFLLFPVPAKYFVMIIGAISFLRSIRGTGGSRHLRIWAGWLFGYIYLKGGAAAASAPRSGTATPKWKMNRLRRKFNVYSGGRSDWDRKVH